MDLAEGAPSHIASLRIYMTSFIVFCESGVFVSITISGHALASLSARRKTWHVWSLYANDGMVCLCLLFSIPGSRPAHTSYKGLPLDSKSLV